MGILMLLSKRGGVELRNFPQFRNFSQFSAIFTLEVTQASGRVPFLDIYLISLRLLHSAVYWKPTHGAAYVPWLANQPRHVRVGWIKAESIRYARICSHPGYFELACEHLQWATRRLQYPKDIVCAHVVDSQDRWRWMKRVNRTFQDAPSLSQAEGVGGREENPRVHVLHCKHHGVVAIGWARVLHCLKQHLSFLRNCKLFAILQPPANVSKFFRTRAHSAPWNK